MAIEFLDSAPTGGFEFIDEGKPAPAADIESRFKDLNYTPSFAEWQAVEKSRESETVGGKASRLAGVAGKAAGGLLGTIKNGIESAFSSGGTIPERIVDGLQTVLEGAARGTRDDFHLVMKLAGKVLAPDLSVDENWKKYLLARAEEKYPRFSQPMNTQRQVPQADIDQWRKDWERDEKPQAEYRKFLNNRSQLQTEIQEGDLLPQIIGRANPESARALSLGLSPMALVPFAKGASIPAKVIPKASAAIRAAEAAGKGSQVAKVVAGKAAEMATAAVLDPATAKTLGIFSRLAKDTKAAQWMRSAADTVSRQVVAPVKEGAKATLQGAAQGAAIGTVLGATDGKEGAAAGFGSGATLGGLAGLSGRIAAGKSYQRKLEDADIANWLSTKTESELAKIKAANLTRQQALRRADSEGGRKIEPYKIQK